MTTPNDTPHAPVPSEPVREGGATKGGLDYAALHHVLNDDEGMRQAAGVADRLLDSARRDAASSQSSPPSEGVPASGQSSGSPGDVVAPRATDSDGMPTRAEVDAAQAVLDALDPADAIPLSPDEIERSVTSVMTMIGTPADSPASGETGEGGGA